MPLELCSEKHTARCAVILGGAVVTETLAEPEAQKWICQLCGLIYDPEEGDPDSGIEPGTPFEDIPEDWSCPICGAEKADFRPMEPGEEL